MAVAFVRDHTGVSIKTSGTNNIGVNISTVTDPGNVLVARILFDNYSTTLLPTVTSIAVPAGETATWVFLGAARSPGVTLGAASSGEMWAIRMTVPWPVASYTVTLSHAVVQKATDVREFSGVTTTMRSTTGTNYSGTTTLASATTTGTAPVIGDLAVGFIFGSNAAAAQAGSNNTTGGTWSTASGLGSTGGNVATNNFGVAQYKILTAASHQTYTNSAAMTAGNGAIVAVLQQYVDPAITLAAYRFYAEPALVDGYDETHGTQWWTHYGAAPYDRRGQSFLGNGKQLVSAGFYLSKVGTPTGTIIAHLYAHTGTFGATDGKPTGSPLTTSTTVYDPVSFSLTGAWYDFAFDGSVVLEDGVPYFLILEASGNANSAGNCSRFYYKTPSGHPGRMSTYTATGGPIWSSSNDYDACFRVHSDTALAAQDTTPTVDTSGGDVNAQLRVRLQSTNSTAVDPWDDFQLQWEKNASGTWATPGSKLIEYTTANAPTSQAYPTVGAGFGQTFLGNGQPLIGCEFKVAQSAVGTDDWVINAQLYAHTGAFGAGGMGTGSALATSTDQIAAGDTNMQPDRQWRRFTFDGSFVLQAGVPYVIRYNILSRTLGSVYIEQDSSGTAPGNQVIFTGSAWSAYTADTLFKVLTPPLPTTVDLYDSPNLTDGAATTNRLTGGTGPALADSYDFANLSYSADMLVNATGGVRRVQGFQGSPGALTRVGFMLGKAGSADGTVYAQLWDNTGATVSEGAPVGDLLATSSTVVNWADQVTSALLAAVYFDFPPGTVLTDKPYYIGVTSTNTQVTSGNAGKVGADSSPTHSGVTREAGTSGAWSAPRTFDLVFEVHVAATGLGFTPGKVSEDGLADDVGWPGNNYTELLYSLTFKAADLTAGDTLRFRVLRNGATTGLTYTQTPTVTITKGAGGTAYPLAGTVAAISATTGTIGSVAAKPKVETLTDDFSGSLAKWPGSYGGVVIESGRAKIPNTVDYPGLWTGTVRYDIVNSGVFAQVTVPPGTSGTRETSMEVRSDGANRAMCLYSGDTIYFNTYTASGGTTWGSVTYSATTHAWWKMHSTGAGNLRFSTSPDGVTWTERANATVSWSLTTVDILFASGWYTTGPDSVAYVDNVNVVPVGGTAYPLAGTVAATSATTGNPAAKHPLAGTVAATSAVTGSPAAVHPLAGTVAGATTTTGSPAAKHPLAGTVAAVTDSTGTIDVVVAVYPPITSFSASATTVVSGGAVTFTDTSTNTPTTWSWNFGTGASPATATTAGPHTVTYSTVGTSSVTLTAGNTAGSDTVDAPTSITVTTPVAVAAWVGGAGNHSATAVTVTLPAGTQPGDLAVLIASGDSGTDPAFSVPAGWTFAGKTAATNVYSHIWYRVLQAGDVSVTVDKAGTAGVGVWRNVTWAGMGTFGIRSGTVFTVTAPNVASASGLRLHLFAERSTAATAGEADRLHTLTYGTARYFYPGDTTLNAALRIALPYFSDSFTGSGDNIATFADSSTNAWGVQIALNGTAPAAPATGRPKAYVDGSFQTKPGKIWTGSAWVEKPWRRFDGSTWKLI